MSVAEDWTEPNIVYDGNVGFDDNLLGVEISIHIYTISPDNPSIVYIPPCYIASD